MREINYYWKQDGGGNDGEHFKNPVAVVLNKK